MFKILFIGTVAHVFFLLSIFQIYFQSPVIRGLRPQSDLDNPPAKRVVLFVADGLRDESLRRDQFQRTPFLRSIIAKDGLYAVSHTRLPTESRPGHVALLAGLYEDPSAVLKVNLISTNIHIYNHMFDLSNLLSFYCLFECL